MNDLEAYFRDNTGRQIHKWHHYFEIYDRHLARFRGTDVHVLEFGVAQGGSMQMWKEYFGPRMFKTVIPRNVRLAEAPSFGKPIILYDIGSIGAQTYLSVAEELIRRTATKTVAEAREDERILSLEAAP